MECIFVSASYAQHIFKCTKYGLPTCRKETYSSSKHSLYEYNARPLSLIIISQSCIKKRKTFFLFIRKTHCQKCYVCQSTNAFMHILYRILYLWFWKQSVCYRIDKWKITYYCFWYFQVKSPDGGWITKSNISIKINAMDRNKDVFCYAINSALGETIVEKHTVAVLCKYLTVFSIFSCTQICNKTYS